LTSNDSGEEDNNIKEENLEVTDDFNEPDGSDSEDSTAVADFNEPDDFNEPESIDSTAVAELEEELSASVDYDGVETATENVASDEEYYEKYVDSSDEEDSEPDSEEMAAFAAANGFGLCEENEEEPVAIVQPHQVFIEEFVFRVMNQISGYNHF